MTHSTDQYRKIVYRCNNKYKGDEKCTSPSIREEKLQELFVKAINELITNKVELISNIETAVEALIDNDDALRKIEVLEKDMQLAYEMSEKYVHTNSKVSSDQEKYKKRYDLLVERYDKTQAKYDKLTKQVRENEARAEILRRFVNTLKDQTPVKKFSRRLWSSTVEKIGVIGIWMAIPIGWGLADLIGFIFLSIRGWAAGNKS